MKRPLRLWSVLPAILAAQIAFAQLAPGGGPPPGAPPMPQSPDLPVFAQGGGRVLFSVASEKAVILDLFPTLPADVPGPSADPRNFEGAWGKDQPSIARIEWDMYGNDVPFTATGRAIRDRRVKSTYVDKRPNSNASAECRPPGQPWLFTLYYPFQIHQTKNEIDILFAMDHAVWPIRLGQSTAASGPREYMGESTGRWDGDTLVVETANFKRALWLDFDGSPLSKDARLQFRIRRISYPDPRLEIVTTVHDSKMYTAPWSFVRTFAWRPDKLVFDEYNCEPQASEGGAGSFGLVADPDDQQ